MFWLITMHETSHDVLPFYHYGLPTDHGLRNSDLAQCIFSGTVILMLFAILKNPAGLNMKLHLTIFIV